MISYLKKPRKGLFYCSKTNHEGVGTVILLDVTVPTDTEGVLKQTLLQDKLVLSEKGLTKRPYSTSIISKEFNDLHNIHYAHYIAFKSLIFLHLLKYGESKYENI